MNGGAGTDTALFFFSPTNPATGFSLDISNPDASNAVTIGGTPVGELTSVERLILVGGGLASSVTTGDADDQIGVLGGTVNAGGGDDVVTVGGPGGTGGIGASLVDGGSGTDGLIISAVTSAAYTFSLQASGASILTQNGVTLITATSFESVNVTTGSGNDILTGGAANDTLAGGTGDNTIDGGGGSDLGRTSFENRSGSVVFSNANSAAVNVFTVGGVAAGSFTNIENTIIRGGTGNDTITGGDGIDILAGGAGNDVLDGGAGTADRASYQLENGVTVSLLISGAQATGAGGTDTLSNFEGLIGSFGTDALTGDDNANTISGEGGNDTIFGNGGDDILFAAATDAVSFGAGIGDTPSNLNTLDGGDGNDTLLGAAGVDTLTGGEGNDILRGGDNADSLSGGNGDDSLDGGEASDTIDGGAGVDEARYFNSFVGVNVSLALQGAAQDTGAGLDTLSNIENLSGSFFDDILTGDGGANVLDGGGGADVMTGGAGDDTYIVDDTGDTIIEGIGGPGGSDDTVYTSVSFTLADNVENAIVTSLVGITVTGNESIFGNVITGNVGDDTLIGGGFGEDTLSGGDGNDNIEGNGTLIGGVGDDNLEGSGTLDGGVGDDNIVVHSGSNNMALGGDGNDFLIAELVSGIGTMDGGAGDDLFWCLTAAPLSGAIEGGAGTDILVTRASLTALTVTGVEILETGTRNISATAAQFETFDTIRAFDLGGQDDPVFLTLAAAGTIDLTDELLGRGVTFTGSSGNDVITTSNGDDSINGGAGDDTLDGGTGTDALAGGSGNDTYVMNNANDTVTELAGEGTDTFQTSVSLTLSANVENAVVATAAGITVTGNALENTMTGNAGGDLFFGGDGADTLGGGNGDDTLDGGNGNDALDGGAGADTASYATAASAVTVSLAIGAAQDTLGAGTDMLSNIENLLGSALNDTLTGGAAANTIDGGAGNDTLDGGAGADTASYASAASGVTVNLAIGAAQNTLGAGIDMLSNFESLLGSAFNDTLTGDGGANTLSGGNGDDALSGGAGNDTLDGGGGNDTASYAAAASGVTVSLAVGTAQDTFGAGIDTLSGVEILLGSAFGDTLTGGVGNDTLAGGAGNDTLDGDSDHDLLAGETDDDTLIGGTGDDTYVVNTISDTITELSGEGIDTVLTSVGYILQDNVENLVATAVAGVFVLGIGNALDNVMTGGASIDLFSGGDGNDTLTGGGGDDTLEGGGGSDTLHGGTGNNTLHGGTGNDTLDGGAGNDVFNGGTELDGGAENDTVSYASALSGVTVDLTVTGSQNTGGAGIDTLSNVESLTGSAFDDTLSGTTGANIIHGGDGNDTLYGWIGNDTLDGGAGNDTLLNASGNDSINGGLGIDTITYAHFGAGVSVNLSVSGAQDTGVGGIDTLTSIENLTGSSFNDVLTGDGAANVLEGGSGADVLNGGDGWDTASYGSSFAGVSVSLAAGSASGGHAAGDTLTGIENLAGSSFSDALTGNAGANILVGLAGSDVLDGGIGADALIGGAGDDTYVVDDVGDLVTELAGEGRDTVFTRTGVVLAGGELSFTLAANVEDVAVAAGFTGAINLVCNGLANLMVGNGARNGMNGGAGADFMVGGGGDDLYIVDDIGDVAIESAGEGRDTVYTSTSFYSLGDNDIEDVAVVGTGGFYVVGNALANLMVGGAGIDSFDGGAGADFMVGGAGNDNYFVDNIGDIVIEGAGGGRDTVYTSVAFYSLGDNEIEDVVVSGGGDSYVIGNALANLMVGGAGIDALDGGAGADFMVGGAGNDFYFVDNIGDVAIESAGEGRDTVYAAISYQLGDGEVEDLALTGSGSINASGNALSNLLVGNGGSNALRGNGGGDVLVGGAGSDRFVYGAASEGGDVITDFVSGADRIQVAATGFGGGLVAGGAASLVAGAAPAATQAFGQFLYNTGNGQLLWDADGTGGGAAVLLATLSGAPAITASDIEVVSTASPLLLDGGGREELAKLEADGSPEILVALDGEALIGGWERTRTFDPRLVRELMLTDTDAKLADGSPAILPGAWEEETGSWLEGAGPDSAGGEAAHAARNDLGASAPTRSAPTLQTPSQTSHTRASPSLRNGPCWRGRIRSSARGVPTITSLLGPQR